MEPVTRRNFLVAGSVGAAGAAAAFGTGWALPSSADDEPALTQEEIDAVDGPIVVQLKDPAAGELEVLFGEQEVVFTDQALAAQLLRATQS